MAFPATGIAGEEIETTQRRIGEAVLITKRPLIDARDESIDASAKTRSASGL